jgi:hypothetical protein
LPDGHFACAHYFVLDIVEDLSQSISVADIDPMVPTGGKGARCQKVNIGLLAADKQDSFSRGYASVNFRRQYIAHEWIAQRD